LKQTKIHNVADSLEKRKYFSVTWSVDMMKEGSHTEAANKEKYTEPSKSLCSSGVCYQDLINSKFV